GALAAIRGFDSVYFGGGTPSYVDPLRLGRVLGTLEEVFGISSNGEITVEANPDDLDPSRLLALRGIGVNRLSIGVQSLVDAELLPLERRHDAAAARRAVSEAARVFGNVSADLMIGIPGQTRETLLASVDGLLEAGVRHLSVYLLEIDKAPKLVALKKERPALFAGDDELGEAGLREPAQPEVLDAHARSRLRCRGALVRWTKALCEHGNADRIPQPHAGRHLARRDVRRGPGRSS